MQHSFQENNGFFLSLFLVHANVLGEAKNGMAASSEPQAWVRSLRYRARVGVEPQNLFQP